MLLNSTCPCILALCGNAEVLQLVSMQAALRSNGAWIAGICNHACQHKRISVRSLWHLFVTLCHCTCSSHDMHASACNSSHIVDLEVLVAKAWGSYVVRGWFTCHTSQQKTMPILEVVRGLTLLLSWLLMQAGVDLGSVRADQESEKKRRGKSKKQALPKAQLRPKRRAPISQVLLVGGSTRMPAMRRFVLNMTGLEVATLVQPDEVDPSTNHASLLSSASQPLCRLHDQAVLVIIPGCWLLPRKADSAMEAVTALRGVSRS